MSPRNRNVEVFLFQQWRHSVPFLSFGIKNVAKSKAVSRILLTFVAELEQTEKNGCVEDSNE